MTAAQKQRDLFTRRFRVVKPPDPSEVQIHISLCARLDLLIRRDVLWFHVPNGELRDKRAAAKLKAMHVLPGVADLLFIFRRSDAPDEPGQDSVDLQASTAGLTVLFLELKAPRRKPSPVQIQFAEFARSIHADCHYEWADSVDAAWQIVESYGLINKRVRHE
jgi:hypothetical protein